MKIEEIKNPEFLKKMDNDDLNNLSTDIRNFIISSVSKTGGHLSSNLGIVDLTIALHKVFDYKKDKIIFDVGHQCYTHKILTGRAKDFEKLRQYKGLSGFQKRCESKYDVYEAGHSSTSISAALGFAMARDMNHEKYNVIAVIGDGSISNGLSFEALNHIGYTNTKVIVILNDNEMSISENVGALHNALDKLRSRKGYIKTKNRTKNILFHIPLIGKWLYKTIKMLKKSLKDIYNKKSYIFDDLGFNYFGPIDGHDYKELITYLELAKNQDKPVLLHVITKKGKGYKFAEEDKVGKWHGVGKFDIATGEIINNSKGLTSWSEVISNHLMTLLKDDKDIIVITPAMASGSKLLKLKEKYPKNFIDVGIAEEHALVLANALAVNGKKPFVSIYSTFMQRGYDAINHDIARMNSHVVIGIDRAGIVGEDGETHQGIYDIALLRHIPNMNIMAPKDSIEALDMLYTAFNTNKPFAIRYSRNKIEYKTGKYKKIKIGSWERIKNGNDITIITYGDFVNKTIEISEKVKYDVEIINARFIKPFDEVMFKEILNSKRKIYVYEEVCYSSSLGEELQAYANKNGYKNKITCFSIKDEFILQGKYDIILKELHLDTEYISSYINKEGK